MKGLTDVPRREEVEEGVGVGVVHDEASERGADDRGHGGQRRLVQRGGRVRGPPPRLPRRHPCFDLQCRAFVHPRRVLRLAGEGAGGLVVQKRPQEPMQQARLQVRRVVAPVRPSRSPGP